MPVTQFATRSLNRAAATLTLVALGLLTQGCRSGAQPPSDESSASAVPASSSTQFALFGPPPKRTPIQIWAENCSRCHNSRSPDTYSDQQWEIIVHHMRLRANLTGEQARQVVKFLQSGH